MATPNGLYDVNRLERFIESAYLIRSITHLIDDSNEEHGSNLRT